MVVSLNEKNHDNHSTLPGNIGALLFGALWAYWGMPENTQPK